MNLPPELHKRLVDELRFAVSKMGEARVPNESLYYFSVFFGEPVRILNWYWDKDLALIWSVMQHASNAISSRMHQMNQGERMVVLSGEYFDALTREAEALLDYIEHQGDEAELCQVLGRFAELTYATTGNGHYLLEKGIIKLAN